LSESIKGAFQPSMEAQISIPCGGPNSRRTQILMDFRMQSGKSPIQICQQAGDLNTETGKKQFLAKKMNNLAMASFTMAFTREGIMRLVSKAKTKEWPEGLAYLVAKELNKKFKPNDIISKVEMRQN
jgi:hypothetical protein